MSSWHAKAYGGYASDSVEAQENALMMRDLLVSLGWTENAVAGLLGNQASESGFNPWRWEGDTVLASTDTTLIQESMVHGYGLFQFTPAGKYIYSSYAQGLSEYGPNYSDRTGNLLDGAAQLRYVDAGYGGYYPTDAYPLSFQAFKTSTASPAELASAWLYNYERPADPGATESYRRQQAEAWYSFLTGNPYIGGLPVWLLKYIKNKRRRG